MDNVDGIDEDAFVWNKIDHCQYISPRNIVTRCRFATTNPDQ